MKFWLPTHEKAILAKYYDSFPSNLIIRQSSAMLDTIETQCRNEVNTCSVGHNVSTLTKQCKAYTQGGKCLECRMCWDPSILNINYPLH